MKNHRGIALKLVNSKTGISSREIINSHNKIIQEKGSVWFSSSIPISDKREIDKVLFVVSTENREVYVLADILGKNIKSEKFIPNNCDELIPSLYQNEKKAVWLHLTNMQVVDNEYIKNAIVYYSDGKEENIKNVMQKPRTNRAYYSWITNSNQFDLI